jgi:hypothetical protein
VKKRQKKPNHYGTGPSAGSRSRVKAAAARVVVDIGGRGIHPPPTKPQVTINLVLAIVVQIWTKSALKPALYHVWTAHCVQDRAITAAAGIVALWRHDNPSKASRACFPPQVGVKPRSREAVRPGAEDLRPGCGGKTIMRAVGGRWSDAACICRLGGGSNGFCLRVAKVRMRSCVRPLTRRHVRWPRWGPRAASKQPSGLDRPLV